MSIGQYAAKEQFMTIHFIEFKDQSPGTMIQGLQYTHSMMNKMDTADSANYGRRFT